MVESLKSNNAQNNQQFQMKQMTTNQTILLNQELIKYEPFNPD
jgi:hypothetical protein